MNIHPGYCFDDVLLVPKYSQIPSRSTIDLSVDLGKGIKLDIPVSTANMKHICGIEMTNAITGLGGLAVQHRFCSPKEQEDLFLSSNNKNLTAVSIGVQETDKEILHRLVKLEAKIVCIDVAHGDHDNCIRMTQYISKTYPEILLIAGNVATAEGATRLAEAGADIVRSGVGGGSLCSTRIETGNGVPQLTALSNIYKASRMNISTRKYKIIADGGIRVGGDVCKALCFSDLIMLGGVLAGTNECPGEIITIDGVQYKEFSGSSTFKSSYIEGVSSLAKCKGSVITVIQKLMEGLRSGMSYQNATNLKQLRIDPQFVQITQSGLKESHPHSFSIRK